MTELLFHPLLFSPRKHSMVSRSVKTPVQNTKVIENKLEPLFRNLKGGLHVQPRQPFWKFSVSFLIFLQDSSQIAQHEVFLDLAVHTPPRPHHTPSAPALGRISPMSVLTLHLNILLQHILYCFKCDIYIIILLHKSSLSAWQVLAVQTSYLTYKVIVVYVAEQQTQTWGAQVIFPRVFG